MKFDFFANNLEFKNQVKDLTKHFGLTDFTYNFLQKIYQENALRNTKKLMVDIDYPKSYNGKKIVFNVINGIYGTGTFFTGAVAKSLQLRGHQPLILTCGGALSMCTAGITIESPKKPCKNCINYAKQFYDILDIPHKTYFDYISKERPSELASFTSDPKLKVILYKGIDATTLAKNSADRYFEGKINKIGYDKIFSKELANAIISVDVAGKLVEEEKPDILVSQQQHFSAWGGITEYCKSKGIRIIEPAKGYNNNSVGFDINKTNKARFDEYYGRWRKRHKLTTEEGTELWYYNCQREIGRSGDTALFNFDIDADMKSLIQDNQYKKTYVMFTNIPYDAGLHEVKRGFKDVYDWVDYTIELFKNKPDCRLIIKVHPVEKVFRAQNTLSDYIKQNILSNNIKTIPADTRISPYSLYHLIDVGIVYSGTLGIELSLQGIPTIVAGNASYSKSGFTFDASTKEDYKALLSKNLKMSKQQQKMASVYAYYYFIKTFIPINFFYNNNFLDVGWNIESINQLAPGKDKYLDVVCDYIANGGVYQKWK